MAENNIDKIKVVIVGHMPLKNEGSFGFAYDQNVCDSTKLLINFAVNEMNMMLQDKDVVSFDRSDYNGTRSNCNLVGWIHQGKL